MQKHKKDFDVIIIGAGSAGLGVAVVLDKLGVDYTVLERSEVGSSFKK